MENGEWDIPAPHFPFSILHSPSSNKALHEGNHLRVPGIRAVVLGTDAQIDLWRLENQRDTEGAFVRHQPAEGLDADLALPYERVAVTVGAEASGAVVEMEETRRLPGFPLEFVQRPGE